MSIRLVTRAARIEVVARPLSARVTVVPGGYELHFPTTQARDDALHVIRRNLDLVRHTVGDPFLEVVRTQTRTQKKG